VPVQYLKHLDILENPEKEITGVKLVLRKCELVVMAVLVMTRQVQSDAADYGNFYLQ